MQGEAGGGGEETQYRMQQRHNSTFSGPQSGLLFLCSVLDDASCVCVSKDIETACVRVRIWDLRGGEEERSNNIKPSGRKGLVGAGQRGSVSQVSMHEVLR